MLLSRTDEFNQDVSAAIYSHTDVSYAFLMDDVPSFLTAVSIVDIPSFNSLLTLLALIPDEQKKIMHSRKLY